MRPLPLPCCIAPHSPARREQRESPEKGSAGAAEAAEEAGDDEGQEELEDEKIQRLLEEGDAIEAAFNCAAVSAMDKADGVFLLCTSSLYVIEGYGVNSLGEIVPLEPRDKKEEKEAAAAAAAAGEANADSQADRKRKWAYDLVRAVERRRYLLQHVAVELFSSDGRNQLIVFSPADREEALKCALTLTHLTHSYHHSLTILHSHSLTWEPMSVLRLRLSSETSLSHPLPHCTLTHSLQAIGAQVGGVGAGAGGGGVGPGQRAALVHRHRLGRQPPRHGCRVGAHGRSRHYGGDGEVGGGPRVELPVPDVPQHARRTLL